MRLEREARDLSSNLTELATVGTTTRRRGTRVAAMSKTCATCWRRSAQQRQDDSSRNATGHGLQTVLESSQKQEDKVNSACHELQTNHQQMSEHAMDHSSKPEVVGSNEAVQRMMVASRVNIACPSRPVSPAFSVEQCSSDAMTRGGKVFVSPSRISSTLKGIPPPSCLIASPSFGNSVSSGQRTSVFFLNRRVWATALGLCCQGCRAVLRLVSQRLVFLVSRH